MLKRFFKKIFRRLAIYLVTLWARRAYDQGVRAAESRRNDEIKRWNGKGNCMVYLACDTFHPDHLITYTKRQFKIEKHVYGMAARLLTMNTLKRGCYYHTADRWGENGLPATEKEIRRKAFIKERLRLAKLI